MPAKPRKRISDEAGEEVQKPVSKKVGNYFIDDGKAINFISTGNTLFDLVLGGGLPLGRMSNIIGDAASSKTLCAIEACCNFLLQYPGGTIRYVETENAFDMPYAEALGLDISKVEFPDEIFTIEDLSDDVFKTIEKNSKSKKALLYVVDSYDALSSEAELKRDIRDGTFGGDKAKKGSEFFRRLNKKMGQCNIHFLIVSQIREKLSIKFGEKTSRSGGKALDFYASQIVQFATLEKIKKTISGVQRPIGVNVRARCKKNKVGLPFRECDFTVLFGYGVEDVLSMVEFLFKADEKQKLEELGIKERGYKVFLNDMRNEGGEKYRQLRKDLQVLTRNKWCEIEDSFIPRTRKY